MKQKISWTHFKNLMKNINGPMKKEIKNTLLEHRNEEWVKTLSILTDDAADRNTMWKLMKKVNNKTNRNHPIHGQRGLTYINKANTIADTLEETFTPNKNIADAEVTRTKEQNQQVSSKQHRIS